MRWFLFVVLFLALFSVTFSHADVILTDQEFQEFMRISELWNIQLPRLRMQLTELQSIVDNLELDLLESRIALTSSKQALDNLQASFNEYASAKELEIWIYRGVILILIGGVIYLVVK